MCWGDIVLSLHISKKNNIENNFNKDKQTAGRDFVRGFLKRHPKLSLRRPEAVSLNRVFGLNGNSVKLHFHNLTSVMTEYTF